MINKIFEIIIAKVTSARFIVTLAVIFTLCWTVMNCYGLLIKITGVEIKDEKTFALIKDVLFMLLGAFIFTVSSIVTLYFGREDRKDYQLNRKGLRESVRLFP